MMLKRKTVNVKIVISIYNNYPWSCDFWTIAHVNVIIIIVFLSYTVCLLQASLNQGPGVCILGPSLLDMEQAVGQLSYKLSRVKAVLWVKLKRS